MSKYQDALFTLVTNSSQFLKENKLEGSQFMEWHNKSKDLLQELVDKETKYQALETELGCPLEVREKTLDSFYCPKFESDKKLYTYYVYAFNNEELFIRLIYSQYDEYYNEETTVSLKDYGKTWWLKEDLKDE